MAAVKIRELPEDDRPREKLLRRGAHALTDRELLAILLRTGVPGANAVEIGGELLHKHHSLGELARCTAGELSKQRGVGPAKAVQLAAAFELGARLAREKITRQKIDSPESVCELLGAELRALRKETLRVVLLDTRYRLLGTEEISLGSVNESIAHPREIFRPAFLMSAYAIIVVHNHPSGDPAPSASDHSLTRRLAEVAELTQIRLLDHVIIGAPAEDRAAYFSFKEAGVL
ncbi:MAG: DNA repair protein RadC [Verrucomicrobiota bacterium]|nr:DNA repair protein RadC [Verrucomicrobiota bacterium]